MCLFKRITTKKSICSKYNISACNMLYSKKYIIFISLSFRVLYNMSFCIFFAVFLFWVVEIIYRPTQGNCFHKYSLLYKRKNWCFPTIFFLVYMSIKIKTQFSKKKFHFPPVGSIKYYVYYTAYIYLYFIYSEYTQDEHIYLMVPWMFCTRFVEKYSFFFSHCIYK